MNLDSITRHDQIIEKLEARRTFLFSSISRINGKIDQLNYAKTGDTNFRSIFDAIKITMSVTKDQMLSKDRHVPITWARFIFTQMATKAPNKHIRLIQIAEELNIMLKSGEWDHSTVIYYKKAHNKLYYGTGVNKEYVDYHNGVKQLLGL